MIEKQRVQINRLVKEGVIEIFEKYPSGDIDTDRLFFFFLEVVNAFTELMTHGDNLDYVIGKVNDKDCTIFDHALSAMVGYCTAREKDQDAVFEKIDHCYMSVPPEYLIC
jgi:hypothetical protein